VPAPTQRLVSRIRRDFTPPGVAEVIDWLGGLPDEAYGHQDAERIQTALVIAASGHLARFRAGIRLLRLDWRDVLVAGGLAHEDWRERLGAELST
jgi:hypothetical protein